MSELAVPIASPLPERSSAFGRAATALLVIIVVLVFGRLCVHDFTWWDDAGTVHHNPWLNPPSGRTIFHYWTTPAYGLYIPVTYSVWTALAFIARVRPDDLGISLNPWFFHTTNVFIHVMSVVVVFRILRLLNAELFAAFAGALLFALHPIQVEAVAWVSGLKDVLCGLLALLALWQYLNFAISDQEDRASAARYVIATALLILAMLAKPAAMTLPLAALAMDRWCIERPWRRIVPAVLGWIAIAIPVAIAAKVFQPATEVPPVSFWEAPLIACDSLAFYLYKLVIPLGLCVDYGRTPAKVLTAGWCYWDWVAPAALGAWLIVGARRRPILLAAAVIFLAGCLPVLGFTRFLFQQFSTTADHYLYFSMLGPALAVAWLLSQWPTAKLRLGAAIVLLFFALLAIRQGKFWANDLTLFKHAVDVNHGTVLSCNNLGAAYERAGQRQAAADLFRRATEIAPDDPRSFNNLADAEMTLAKYDDALSHSKTSLDLQSQLPPWSRPYWAIDHERMGQCLILMNRPEEAIPYLQIAAETEPENQAYADTLRDARKRQTTEPTTLPTPATK